MSEFLQPTNTPLARDISLERPSPTRFFDLGAAPIRRIQPQEQFNLPEAHTGVEDVFFVAGNIIKRIPNSHLKAPETVSYFRLGDLVGARHRTGETGTPLQYEWEGDNLVQLREVELSYGDSLRVPLGIGHQHRETDQSTELYIVKIPVLSPPSTAEKKPSTIPTQWHVELSEAWSAQFYYFQQLFDKIKNIPGDVVECGVGQGISFHMLAVLIKNYDRQKSALLGLDSFEGWPAPSTYDDSPRHPQEGEWAVPEEQVVSYLLRSTARNLLPDLNMWLVKGFLKDSLPNWPQNPIAFIHLDVDLYEGYRDGLDYLSPYVVKGGIIALDEYKEFPLTSGYDGKIEKWPGCTKAVDDFLAEHSDEWDMRYYEGTKKYYLVKTR